MFRPMRRFKQQLPEEECIKVLKEEKRATLALNGDDGYPYALPINYIYDEETGHIFVHGAVAGYKFDCIQRNPKASFVVHDQGYKPEGKWYYIVRSVIAFGQIHRVTDPDRLLKYLRPLGLKYYPTAQEVDDIIARTAGRVAVFEFVPEHMTGKLVKEK